MSNEVKQDNTRVNKPFKPQKFKLTQKQKDNIRKQQMSKRTQPQLYDKDKADYYKNMQNIVNSSFFGAGFNSGQYRNNPMTEQGQRAIESSFNYTKTNVADLLSNVAGIGVQGAARKAAKVYSQFTKSPFKKTGGDLGKMNKYTKNGIIGEGAEAVVVKDTPTTVAKFTDIPVSEMTQRDAVANTIKHNYIGYVTKGKTKFPTYVQQKVKVLTEKTFPKYVKKLDKSMKKNGFKRVEDPNVYGRAYTNGKIVIDDIAEGNVGLTSGNPWLDKILPDWMKSPKIIDMAYQTVPEWRAMGYKLQKGGKVVPKLQDGKKLKFAKYTPKTEVDKLRVSNGLQTQEQLQQNLKQINKKLRKKLDNMSHEERMELARRNSPHSEVVAYKDKNGKVHSSINPSAGNMSNADPVGEFVIAGAALNPAFKLAGRGIEYGLARYGTNQAKNWARGRIISRNLNDNINKSSLSAPTFTPTVRTKLGDVEINNPQLAYRQGNDLGRTYIKYKDVDNSMAQHQVENNLGQTINKEYVKMESILDKSIKEGTYDPTIGINIGKYDTAYQQTPMYSSGFLWYGAPRFNQTLREGSLQSGLLTHPINNNFIVGNSHAKPYLRTGTGIRTDGGVTRIVTNQGRLIPSDTDNLGLNLTNIDAYTWIPGYGYKRVVNPKNIQKVIDFNQARLQHINNYLKQANDYGDSKERLKLFQDILKEAQNKEYIKDPSLFELPTRPQQLPTIKIKSLEPGTNGAYDRIENTIELNKYGYRETTPYHEALHYNKVGRYPSFFDNKQYIHAYDINDLDKSTDILLQHEQLGNFYRDKVNKLVYSDTPEYYKNPTEFTVFGLQGGKSVGIQPFQKPPQTEEEIYTLFHKAADKVPWLYEIDTNKATSSDLWKILTGNYLPITVGGITGFSYNNK